MTNDEFNYMYGNYLAHKWVTSKDKAKAEQQKKAEQEYNKKYYREHREELLASNREKQAREAMRLRNRNFTPEEALADLNARQKEAANVKRPYTDEEVYKYRQNLADKFEQLDVDVRNRRAAETGKAQGLSRRESELSERQQRTLSRRSKSDTEASKAQVTAAATRSKNKRVQRLNEAASNAQSQAAKTARQNRTLKIQSPASTAASKAQSQAAKSRSAYQRSTEAKFNRAVARAASKVNNMVNTGKASVQKVKDTINSTSDRIQKAKKSVTGIINKYFG